MAISGRDLFLVAPDLALAVLATTVILLDLVFGRKRLVLVAALLGLIVPLIAGIALWQEVDAEGPQIAFNGSLVVDKFALFFKFLILGSLSLVLVASAEYAERFRPYQAEFIGLMLFSASGLMLLAASADLITIYLALELATLPLVALAAFTKAQARSIEAAVKYLILSAVSSAVLIYGFAFLYGATGTVRLLSETEPTIAQVIATKGTAVPFGGYGLLAGAILATAGFGFKLSLVPFQMWTPDVYEGAPTPVAAFLAVASKAAAFAIVLRLFFTAFGDSSQDWTTMFAVLAAVTMTVGNTVAIAQSNVKRLLGYSAIAHAGYMLIGVAAVSSKSFVGQGDLGMESTLFYLVAYAAMTLAAFFVIIAICDRTNDDSIESLAGIGTRSPMLAAVLSLALLGLTGIPPTVGFMGKLFLFNAAVNADLLWLAVFGAVNSVVSAYYYFGIIRTLYLRDPVDRSPISPALTSRFALAVTSASIVILGFWPSGLMNLATTTAIGLAP